MKKNCCSLYYIAHVEKERCWLLASIVRATEHISFDRSLDSKTFEFFVPHATEAIFLQIADLLKKEGMILSLEKQYNRLCCGLV